MALERGVRLYDLEGNKLEDFKSGADLIRKIGGSAGNLTASLSGKSVRYDSFQVRYLTDGLAEKIGAVDAVFNSGKQTKPVAKYWGTKLVAVYNTYSEAADKNKINVGNVSHSVERDVEFKGFKFKSI